MSEVVDLKRGDPAPRPCNPRRTIRAAILQGQLPHYRVPFFAKILASTEPVVDVYACDVPEDVVKALGGGTGHLYSLRRGTVWTPFGSLVVQEGLVRQVLGGGYDVIIAEQSSRYLAQIVLQGAVLAQAALGFGPRWLWFGHGRNFQGETGGAAVALVKRITKKFYTRACHGAIAYTELSRTAFEDCGVPASRVWVTNNTMDVESSFDIIAQTSPGDLELLKREIEIEKRGPIILFSGQLYADKRLDMLLRAVAKARSRFPGIVLLVVGEGADRPRCEAVARELKLDCVRFLGKVVVPERVGRLMMLSDLMAMPGFVGLAIVHGFSFGVPILTTDLPGHGPEIAYLKHGINGWKTAFEDEAYLDGLLAVLGDDSLLARLKKGAIESARGLTLERMARSFLKAIRSAATDDLG